MSNETSISVVMAVFNGARFLPEQLASVRRQSRQPDELVVVDDASEDGSVAILEEFSRSTSFPVQLLRNPANRGSTQSFERGLMAARYGLVALADQDDAWYPRKLEVLAGHLASRSDATFAFSDARLIDEDGSSHGGKLWPIHNPDTIRCLAQDPFGALISRRVVPGATGLFRRAVVEAGTPFPQGMPFLHDGWLELVAAALGAVIAEGEPLMDYRVHAHQQFGIRSPERDARRSTREKLGTPLKYDRRLRRLDTIEAWLSGAPLQDSRRRELAAQIAQYRRHIEVRSTLSPRLHQRVIPISRELVTRRYRRWSDGTRSALKDLVGQADSASSRAS